MLVQSHIPALIDMTVNQYDVSSGSSYWTSSYVTSTEGKQFLAISHILSAGAGPKPYCRSSVLDLETLDYWVDLIYCTLESDPMDQSQPLDNDYGTYGFRSTSNDSISSMYTWADTNASFSFNISWEATSHSLLNGGSGVIAFGEGPINATEWATPAASAAGSLTLNGTVHEIDTDNSFTWYDRQISYGAPRNWTWFELNFPGSDLKASVWAGDHADGATFRFGTVRAGESMLVLAYDLVCDMSSAWTSPSTGLTYPLRWTLRFENGDYLDVESVRDDQEMYGPDNLSDSAYEGFVVASGSFMGQESAFGVVEMVTVY